MRVMGEMKVGMVRRRREKGREKERQGDGSGNYPRYWFEYHGTPLRL